MQAGGSCALQDCEIPFPKDCPQISADMKKRLLQWTGVEIDCTPLQKELTAKRKAHMGKYVREQLPLSWYERAAKDQCRLFEKLGVCEVLDLGTAGGFSFRGLLELMSESKPEDLKRFSWAGVTHNPEHSEWLLNNLGESLLTHMVKPESGLYEKTLTLDEVKSKFPTMVEPPHVITVDDATDSSAGDLTDHEA